jgi:dCMP deaminase
MDRPNANRTWIEVAQAVSRRSRCVRSQVGCVIVDGNGRIVATGYNGPPANWLPKKADGSLNLSAMSSSCDLFCARAIGWQGDGGYTNCPSVHAEMNALMVSDRTRREHGTLYVTRAPCFSCAKAVANSGVDAVYAGPVPSGYDQVIYDEVDQGLQLMQDSGLVVVRFG